MEPIKVNKKCTAFSKYCAFFVKKYIFCTITVQYQLKISSKIQFGAQGRTWTGTGFNTRRIFLLL